MALKQHQGINRYKNKSGRGGFVLAAFILFMVLLVVGGYFLQRFLNADIRRQSQPLPESAVVQQPKVAPQQPLSSSVEQPGTDAVIPKEPVKHYFDEDTRPEPVQRPLPSGKALLAIIIDDMGSSIQEAASLAGIGVPLTFSIIPGLRHDREVAAFAAAEGVEVMLHMPMQSREYPQRRMESNGLLLAYDTEELKQRVEGYLELLPQAVGANNHMGSAFTEDALKMRVVLGVLKQRGFFFVDSVTTKASTGFSVAHELGMRSGRRDVFLDNEQNEAYIRGQLAKAVARARKWGQAIAIGHPHPATIAALSKALPQLQQQGITLVSASRLVR